MLADDLAERLPLRLGLHGEEHGAVGAAVGTVGNDRGVAHAGARRRLAAVEGVVGGVAHPLGEGVEERGLDDASLTGGPALVEGGEGANRAVDGRADVADADADFGQVFAVAGGGDHARLALQQQVEGLAVLVGAARAVAGDRGDDERGVVTSQPLRRESETIDRPWPEVLHQYIGRRDQPLQDPQWPRNASCRA